MRNGVWRVEQVRAAEAALMATLPEGTLMHRAATGLASRIGRMLSQTRGCYGSTVTLLVGAGDNGGDALYAGAQLARRGARVLAVEVFPGRSHPGGVAALLDAGGRLVDEPPAETDLAVDGIFGIGGRPGLPARAGELVTRLAGVPMIAVDVPSGVDVDTGAVNSDAVRADITVTFGCRKPALMVGTAAEHAGMIDLVDIGLDPYLPEPYALIPVLDDIARWWPRPHAWDNKYTRGVLGVCAGSFRYPGAGELAVAGALAGPAGYIRYAGTAARHVRYRYPEVVTKDRVADAGRVQAWVAGPGMGTDSVADSQLRSALAAPVPMCLDADALTLVAHDPSMLVGRRHGTVMTPHDREFARLSGHAIGDDRIGEAVALAKRLECVVLLKGYRTVVADAFGNVHVNPTGDPALATAGSGDVLAGLIGSLLAAGLSPVRSAVAGAFLHGLAGRHAARQGPVTATRIADALHDVVAELS
ncbi:NAD(P)H-hydrate dehydratase [Stackebrandtia soli]|uniref:NAD(P)H-hydrate dehydratase n=1 Tax=Stackebrandtia soli TaxID=1892856 RepID=UPI0039E9194D